jgi:NADPH-dependent 2,4-dienoyl-CoA reductase/sulfur reductase-like enzyme
MYLKPKPKFEITPPHVLNAKGNLFWSTACIVSFFGIWSLGAYQYSVNRKRELARLRRQTGPKVVIVGGNVAGANAAAALTQYHPDVQVKVFEPNRELVFYGLVPLAAAAHRSYDLRCAGPNTLYGSPTWAVTRDAELVPHAIDVIDAEKSRVIDFNGVAHEYDVLVMACGAQLDFTRVKGLKREDYDKHRVAYTPGTIRDSLATCFEGDILLTKIPPAHPNGRQHEGTLLGTVNTVWKYLDFFSGFVSKSVQLHYLTPDKAISDALPQKNVDALAEYWDERKIDVQTGMSLVEVDQKKRVATFENAETKKRERINFRLLCVDLPMRAPEIVARNKLDGPETGGFVDVDIETLQHKKHKNIFAIGDCAATGAPRSYGSVYAQTPILAHNVTQYLAHRTLNAKYDGYSSFPVMMSTWRAMWPEVLGKNHVERLKEVEPGFDVAVGKGHYGHYWDDSDWKYWKGLLQGFYIQSTANELMHWLIFMRARWCSPRWFGWPDMDDGEPLRPETAPLLSTGKRAGGDYDHAGGAYNSYL